MRCVRLVMVLGGFCLFINVPGQDIPGIQGAPGIGGYSRNQVSIYSLQTNLASLAYLKKASLGFYGEKTYLLPGYSRGILLAALPAGPGCFGVRITNNGLNYYRETGLGLMYARKLGDKLSVGMLWRYLGKKWSEGYRPISLVCADLAMLFRISAQWQAGAQLGNPFRIGKQDPETGGPPRTWAMGFGMDASTQFHFCLQVFKSEAEPVFLETGIRYHLKPALAVEGGVSSLGNSGWMGVDLDLSGFRVGLITRYHSRLGWTPGMKMSFQSKK